MQLYFQRSKAQGQKKMQLNYKLLQVFFNLLVCNPTHLKHESVAFQRFRFGNNMEVKVTGLRKNKRNSPFQIQLVLKF